MSTPTPTPTPTPGGKHRAGTVRTVRATGLVALALAFALAAGMLGIKLLAGSRADGTDSADGSGCTPVRLTVATPASVAPAVTSAAERLRQSAPCYHVTVQAAGGAETVRRIASGGAPDVWAPDSSTWLAALENTRGKGGAAWKAGPSLGRSPVVVVTPTRGSKRLTFAPESWSALVNDSGTVRVAAPDDDTASRLAFFASRIGQPERITEKSAAKLIFISRLAAPTGTELFTSLVDSSDILPFPASEQAFRAFDRAHPGVARSFVPAAGTVSLDFPWTTRPGLPEAQRQAAAALFDELTSTRSLPELSKAGLRVDGGSAASYTELPLPPAAAQGAMVAQWDVLRTDMRMLAILDVSGSMRQPAVDGSGPSRAEVTQQASLTALRILPPSSQVGIWVFSTDNGPDGQPWRVVTPVRRLGEKVGGATQRDVLITAAEQLPGMLRGDTALYDTTWAAYQELRDSFDPNYVNSIVIMTDGRNDNPRGGLTLEQLLTKIKATRDPQRPVRIITIGMGEADPAALEQISKATGGTSYIARTANDIRTVLIQALLARQVPVD